MKRNKKKANVLKEVHKAGYPNTLLQSLGIEITYIGPDRMEGKMPVDGRTHQPLGLLHGGASVAFAETLASIGANMLLNLEVAYAVGIEINANHVRGVRSGWVFGYAKPLHVGSTTQVWSVEIFDESKNLVCLSRCTIAVVTRK